MTTVQTFTQQEAKWARRAHIESGHPVTLIGYNPDTDMYEFDVNDQEGDR